MDPLNHFPIVLALVAAFLFAIAAHVQHQGLTKDNTRQASLVVVATTAVLHWLIAPLTISPSYWFTTAALLFALTGLIRPTITVSLWVEGVRRLGPTLNAGLSASGPFFGAVFAVLILGEVLTTKIAIGTTAVICGILITSIRTKGVAYDWPIWALSLPLGAAAGRAIAHSMTKLGYAEVSSPVFVGLVSSTVALVILLIRSATSPECFIWRPRETSWFVWSGILSTGGVFALNVALQKGQVLSVSPIVATSPVFALLLAIFVFRKESITWRTTATIALVVSGVILVILGSQTG